MKSIQIEEPCHEDWSKMNPTQQGAFCGKCEIDVVDFSRLSKPEIKSLLIENDGKHLCGRFENKQLIELNNDFQAWQHTNSKTFQSKFLYALLLVFGLTLFSCSDDDAKQIANFNSIEMQAALSEPDKKIANQLFFHQDAIIADEMVSNLDIIEYDSHIQGLLISTHVADQRELIDYRDNYTLGGAMVVTREYMDYIHSEVNNLVDSTTTLPEEIVTCYNPFETKLFPNPTRDISNLSLYIKESAQFTIEVFSLSGQRVTEIHNGELQEGRHNFQLNFYTYAPGTYFVKVWSEKQDETLKVIRVE